MGFNYSAMNAAIFITRSDVGGSKSEEAALVSMWDRVAWDAFYSDIASLAQLSKCICRKCADHNPEDWN